jgi:hypothetical protein
MTGYAAVARIGRAECRVVFVADRGPLPAGAPSQTTGTHLSPSSARGAIARLREEWWYFRRSIGQLTFYVFDAEAWR